jgi:uncharacterized protein YccT (UPF0319 family)
MNKSHKRRRIKSKRKARRPIPTRESAITNQSAAEGEEEEEEAKRYNSGNARR